MWDGWTEEKEDDGWGGWLVFYLLYLIPGI